MLKIAFAFLAVAMVAGAYADSSAGACAASVEYRQDNYGDVVGTDGSRAHRFGGTTYLIHPDGSESRCRRTSDEHVVCADER